MLSLHVGRYVRVNGTIYGIASIADHQSTAPSSGTYRQICTTSGVIRLVSPTAA